MIRCETPHRMWTVEGKIVDIPGSYGGEGAHVGIEDLTDLLAQHHGKWVKVRVEIIEGPRIYPKTADYPDLPYEVVVVERDSNGEAVHVEVCARRSLESEARHQARALINAGSNHPSGRYTVELVTPAGMVKA